MMSKGTTIPMQPVLALSGDSYSDEPVVQSMKGWADGVDFKEAVLDVLLLRNYGGASSGQQVLHLETAISPEGPWTTVVSFNTPGYQHSLTYCATKEGATNKFERFIRWRLDISDTNLVNWESCFRICVVFK
jgi:hypothetical protein